MMQQGIVGNVLVSVFRSAVSVVHWVCVYEHSESHVTLHKLWVKPVATPS